MEFRGPGSLEVRQGDRVIELPRQKHRALLARLLLSEGEVVSADRLVEDLWERVPPTSAKASLQNFVSQLRRALGAEVLVTRPSGYELRIDPDSLDLARFERLLREAAQRARFRAGDEAPGSTGAAGGAAARGRFVRAVRRREVAGSRSSPPRRARSSVDAELALGRRGTSARGSRRSSRSPRSASASASS